MLVEGDVTDGVWEQEFTVSPEASFGSYMVTLSVRDEVGNRDVAITGRKLDLKTLRRWSGYPGGLRVRNYRTVLADDPTTLVQEAIIRMLPRGRLGRKMRTRLRIFAGAEHTFAAQQPTKLVIKSRKAPATR